jgi:hypothetical protein
MARLMSAGWAQAERLVSELQGLYGPFAFSEKLLQKIWLRGDFDHRAARTTDGETVRVLHPGKWNLLGGPDFKGARLRFGKRELSGDIELHLHARDWTNHGHQVDRAYNQVVLHVVLFPPSGDEPAITGEGRVLPLLVLLPWLHHDLEEYAADEAVEGLARRSSTGAVEVLGVLPPAALSALLRRHAALRWEAKCRYARARLQRLGWEAACHHAALEILGYRFNRPSLLRIATEFPLRAWVSGEVDADRAFGAEGVAWNLQGVRPANHPRARLRQYLRWVQCRADWPVHLAEMAGRLDEREDENAEATAIFRRAQKMTTLREQLADVVCGDALGGTRFDNLVCDGFWPLLTAHTGRDFGRWWSHWYPGDLPPEIARVLRALGVTDLRSQPASHGLAQGLLGWLIEQENRTLTNRVAAAGRGA